MKKNEENSKVSEDTQSLALNEINEKEKENDNNKIEDKKDENPIQEKIKKKAISKKKSNKSLFPYKNMCNKNKIIENDEKEKILKELKENEKNLKKLSFGDFEMVKNLSKSAVSYRTDNTFLIFQSINEIICLIYANKLEEKNNSIVSYNIIDYKKMAEIKNAHNEDITNFRYYLDKMNKKDLILSISAKDNNVKLWNINDVEFLLNINNVNRTGFLKSACFLNYNNQIFIVTCNFIHSLNAEPIKIYDLTGNKIKEINTDNNNTFFIDTYFDNQTNINYIIIGEYGYVKSYDYNNNKKYHKYKENKHIDHYEHHSAIVINNYDVVKLIDTSRNREIRIWDFHSADLLSKIEVSGSTYDNLYGIALLNEEYLFAGCGNSIKLIDLDNEEIINTLVDYNYNVISVKSVSHPKYGDCLLSQDLYEGQIKLWINKINKCKYNIDLLYKKLNED